ncbi:MAG: FliM/FliN family flagellar motor switch protein [Bryobacteraceae bacterium]
MHDTMDVHAQRDHEGGAEPRPTANDGPSAGARLAGKSAPSILPAVPERFADLPLGIEVELDRRRMSVREILRLKPGSVLRMTRSAGENIDIRVGGALMGFGEIVILEERMGVRITDFHESD